MSEDETSTKISSLTIPVSHDTIHTEVPNMRYLIAEHATSSALRSTTGFSFGSGYPRLRISNDRCPDYAQEFRHTLGATLRAFRFGLQILDEKLCLIFAIVASVLIQWHRIISLWLFRIYNRASIHNLASIHNRTSIKTRTQWNAFSRSTKSTTQSRQRQFPRS